MNAEEIFKREMNRAGFELETFGNRPAVKVSKFELDDVVKILSKTGGVSYECKNYSQFCWVICTGITA